MSGNVIVDRIIIVINLLGMLIGFGVFFYTERLSEEKFLDNKRELRFLNITSSKYNESLTSVIPKMAVNLYSSDTKLHYVDIEMHLKTFKKRHLDHLEKNKHIIKDILVDTAGRMQPEEIVTLSGKLIFADRIKNKINDQLKRKIIKDIFFTTFVVQ